MKSKLFSVFDSKVGAFASPWASPTIASGRRAFAGAVADQSSMLNKHPGDYSLFLVGEFDEETGAVHALAPENLGLASSYLLTTDGD